GARAGGWPPASAPLAGFLLPPPGRALPGSGRFFAACPFRLARRGRPAHGGYTAHGGRTAYGGRKEGRPLLPQLEALLHAAHLPAAPLPPCRDGLGRQLRSETGGE